MSDDATFEEWLRCGEFLKRADTAVQFWIGDWLLAGEKKYGETYAQAVDEKQAKTWANYKWVACKVESSRRQEILSFEHHATVAALTPKQQEKWLKKAVEEEWSVHDLRANVTARPERPKQPHCPTCTCKDL